MVIFCLRMGPIAKGFVFADLVDAIRAISFHF